MEENTPEQAAASVQRRSVPSIAKEYFVGLTKRYKKAPPFVKLLVWIFIAVNCVVVTLLVVVGPAKMAQTLYNWSQALRQLRFGWLLLMTIIAVTSFPPLIGWSTSISVCGFAYGLKGWYLAAAGALLGAAMSFVVLRVIFRKRIRSWSQKNRKWVALESVIRARGLPLIILIRLSPFPPWVYANLLFASIETVSFVQFMIATVFYTPKLMIAVWIGSRVAMLSDGSQREKMDTKAKIVNGLSIAIGIAIMLGTGWLIWRLTEKEIKRTPGVSAEDDELATEALETAVDDLEAPLIRSLSPERYRDEPLEPGRELDNAISGQTPKPSQPQA
ncbi:Tlg2-vesicle protein [Tulasnella sp. 417]|nr:Tlg2-vesicle protein [Tulasnella sp. 417]